MIHQRWNFGGAVNSIEKLNIVNCAGEVIARNKRAECTDAQVCWIRFDPGWARGCGLQIAVAINAHLSANSIASGANVMPSTVVDGVRRRYGGVGIADAESSIVADYGDAEVVYDAGHFAVHEAFAVIPLTATADISGFDPEGDGEAVADGKRNGDVRI